MNIVKRNTLKRITFPQPKPTGRFYRPLDNSFQTCHTNGCNYYLAGTYNTNRETVEIISEPFTKEVDWGIGGVAKETFTFITVRCKRNLLHDTLYYSSGVVE